MATESVQAPITKATRPGRWLFRLGWGLFFLGFVIYAVQFFALKQFVVPWYAPILGTVAVIAMLAAVIQQWTVLRIIGLLLCALLTAGQWQFLGWEMRAPEYAGPPAGQKIPTFTAQRGDGSAFTDKDLLGQPTVLLFFRGHW